MLDFDLKQGDFDELTEFIYDVLSANKVYHQSVCVDWKATHGTPEQHEAFRQKLYTWAKENNLLESHRAWTDGASHANCERFILFPRNGIKSSVKHKDKYKVLEEKPLEWTRLREYQPETNT